MVLQECQKLQAAYEPVKTFEENSVPCWTKENMIEVMEILVSSKSGVIKYFFPTEAILQRVLQEFISVITGWITN